MTTLVRPTQIQVMEAFHQHLAESGRHRTTSNELATSRGWSLMEVSAALNQASARGTLIREGGTFRPTVSQVGAPMEGCASPLVERSKQPKTEPVMAPVQETFDRKYKRVDWPSDEEFKRRYEQVLKATTNVRGEMEREFGSTYHAANKQARVVYKRLGLPKPSGKKGKPQAAEPNLAVDDFDDGWTPGPVATVVPAPSPKAAETYEGEAAMRERVAEFWANFEATRPQEPPASLDSPEVSATTPEAIGEAAGGKDEPLSEEANEAGAFDVADAEVITHLEAVVRDLRDDNARLIEKASECLHTVDELSAENAQLREHQSNLALTIGGLTEDKNDLWAKLRQADADLTERDETIKAMENRAAMLDQLYKEAKAERDRLRDQNQSQKHAIDRLSEELFADKPQSQPITVTLTIPRDFLRIGVG